MNGDDTSASAALNALRGQLSDPSLSSSTRVLILVSLAFNRKVTFMDLLTLTRIGKGSLSNHLQKLEGSGYIVLRTKATFSGDRCIIEITEKGLVAYRTLVNTMSALQEDSEQQSENREVLTTIKGGQ
jgi:DNA-binding MarR family transcriptional regulator